MRSSSAVETSQRALVRSSFNLPAEELKALEDLASVQDATVSEVVRKAIAAEAFLASQPEGSRFLVQTPDGELRPLVTPSRMEHSSHSAREPGPATAVQQRSRRDRRRPRRL